MRLFIAVQVPAQIREKGAEIAREMVASGLPIRMVAAQNMHLTLKFLGEADETKAAAVKKALETVAFDKFGVSICGFGAFPSITRPNAIWLGCKSAELGALAAKIDAALAQLGFPHEKFSGHLTIGRAKARCDLQEFAKKYADFDFGAFEAASFALIASQLASGGPVYSVIGEFFAGE